MCSRRVVLDRRSPDRIPEISVGVSPVICWASLDATPMPRYDKIARRSSDSEWDVRVTGSAVDRTHDDLAPRKARGVYEKVPSTSVTKIAMTGA